MQTIALLAAAFFLLGSKGSSSDNGPPLTPPPPPPQYPTGGGGTGSPIGDQVAAAGVRVGEAFLNQAISAAFQTQQNASSGGSGQTTVDFTEYGGKKIGGND